MSSRTLAAEKRYSGTVEESSGSSLSFSVPGTVSKVYVKTGDRVVKGQPIASIDATTLTSSYHAAKASLDQAQDAYDRLKVLYVNFTKLCPAFKNTLYLCIKHQISNEKSNRLHSCFY